MFILPFWSSLALFWIGYNQMFGNFCLMGCQMNYLVGDVIFAPSFFTLFDSLGVIVFLPLVDKFVYPIMEARIYGRPMRSLEKMTYGFGLMSFAMFLGGFIEMVRFRADDAAYLDGYPRCGTDGANAVPCNEVQLSPTGVQACCTNIALGSNCFWAPHGSDCFEDNNFCGNTTVL